MTISKVYVKMKKRLSSIKSGDPKPNIGDQQIEPVTKIDQEANKVYGERSSGKAPINGDLDKIKKQLTKIEDINIHKETKDGVMMKVAIAVRKDIIPNFADHG